MSKLKTVKLTSDRDVRVSFGPGLVMPLAAGKTVDVPEAFVDEALAIPGVSRVGPRPKAKEDPK